jgi:hypothetical protein
MALQPETIRLIEELSLRTGDDPETAVQAALRERLARFHTPEEEEKRRAEVYALVRELQAMDKEHPEAIVDIDEFLYDENGLPK